MAGAVLLGGASQRMGFDKARLSFAGMPMANRIATLLAGLFEDVMLVGGNPPPGASGRAVPDCPGPACALRGVVSALAASVAPKVLIVATDMPLLDAELLLALTAWPEADAVVPRTRDGLHPLCALYRREPALAAARAQLEKAELKLQDFLERLEVSFIGEAALARIDPDGRALLNANDREQFARAEKLFESS